MWLLAANLVNEVPLNLHDTMPDLNIMMQLGKPCADQRTV
jgi:hypothetical protein